VTGAITVMEEEMARFSVPEHCATNGPEFIAYEIQTTSTKSPD